MKHWVGALTVGPLLAASAWVGSAAGATTDSTSAPTLDLETVVRRVLQRNPSLAAARASWTEARARTRRSGALDDPMLDVMVAPRSLGSSSVDPGYRVEITQAFPLFGQRGWQRRVAEADARVAGWDLRTAQLDLVHQARLVFFEYWRIDRAIALNRELLGIAPELRRTTLAKYSSGQVGQQDPLQVDAEVAMLDHEAVMLNRERRVTAAMLAVLMHEPPDQELPPPPRELPPPDTVVVHANLAPRARALRPEMEAAAAAVDAGRAGVVLAGREPLPELALGIAYDRFWSEPELRTSLVASMSLPIHFGRLSAERDAARARLEFSRSRAEVVRDSIEFQVEAAASRLHEQAHDVQIARERLLPLRERAWRAARASYEANRADFLTVLNALRDFLRARLEVDESTAALHQARADLDRALGEIPSALEKEEKP
jgi:outer membrane protein TolC